MRSLLTPNHIIDEYISEYCSSICIKECDNPCQDTTVQTPTVSDAKEICKQ